MINLTKLLKPDPNNIKINKAETELLQYFISNKIAFDQWFNQNMNQYPKIRFAFYYPTAIDFFYDEFKLFTAYFKKTAKGNIQLLQFKMSDVNYTNIKSRNWKPFQDVMLNFLTVLEQTNTDMILKEHQSLLEYQALCTGKDVEKDGVKSSYIKDILSAQLSFSGTANQ